MSLLSFEFAQGSGQLCLGADVFHLVGGDHGLSGCGEGSSGRRDVFDGVHHRMPQLMQQDAGKHQHDRHPVHDISI
jgi:hypothetical protein